MQNFWRWGALLGMGSWVMIFGGAFSAYAQSERITVGYRDYHFGTAVNTTPTGEKPQSKLWWHDGIWWGSLWDPARHTHTIHRFDVLTQSWTSTGTAIDDRTKAKADALWDGQRLYLVSQIFTHNPGPTTSGNGGRLYRYSYDPATARFSLDAGFPVSVNSSISETLVLAKDSKGKLWVTWTEGGAVMINRSLGNDLSWGVPFDLPVQGNAVAEDDISALLAFGSEALAGGNTIGVIWSNQNDQTTYFAVHRDGNADRAWEPKEEALVDSALGAVSYDYINIKPSCDNEGNVYATAKSSLSQSEAPRIFLLKRDAAGVWTNTVVATVSDNHTRPLLLIDGEHRQLYVFMMSPKSGAGIIYMKRCDLSEIAFPPGLGTPFIQSATDSLISNPASTKQCLNSATGLLVLASDQTTRHYFHNYLDLGGDRNQYPLTIETTGSGQVTLNPPGGSYGARTVVTLTAKPAAGFQFNGWSGDLGGLENPATITILASKKVTAAFTRSDGRGQVSHRETQTGGSSNSTTVSTSAGLTAVNKQIYLAAIATKPKVSVSFVSGLGLNWTLVREQCSGRDQTGIEVWMAKGLSSSNGIVTASFTTAASNAVMAVSRYAGVDSANPIGHIISGNTNGVHGDCTGGVDNNAYSFNVRTTLNGAMIYGAATMRDEAHTPGAGYTERAELIEGSFGTASSIAVEDRSLATTTTIAVDGSLSRSADWAMVALEIRPLITTNSSGVSGDDERGTAPAVFRLAQNYPNPFSDNGSRSTLINFYLPEASAVAVNIYNEAGQLVRKLVAGDMAAGRHVVRWNGRNQSGQMVAAGIYLYQMIARDGNGATTFMQTRRMTFLE